MCVGDSREVAFDGGTDRESDGGVSRESRLVGPADAVDRIRVLHVDDDPALLDVTEQYLRREDDRLVVETATAPAEGLDLLAEADFDVAVSDYQMPEMNGLEFLERVREDSGIPFIIFTGRGREEVAVEALNLGADRYLQKGGDPESQYGLLADAIVQEAAHRRAREELRESEQRYRTLVEALPDIVFITDYESKMLWANDALERKTNLTIEDFQMAQEDNPFIHPDDADRVAAHIGEFVESDRRYSDPVDNRFVDADGNTHWYSSIVVKITYQGEPALQFITREVTERKQREQRLERVQRRYETLLATFPDGLVALFDDDFQYIDAGGELLDAGTIEDAHVTDVDAAVLNAVAPEDCRAVFEGERRTWTCTDGGDRFELRLQPVSSDGDVAAGMVVAVPV